jgi:hypothetical protein
MRTSTRLTMLLALGGGALLGAACGSDNKGNPDSRVSDANTTPDTATTPDAAVTNSSATIAITQVAVATPGATTFGGAGISIAFDDLTTPSATPVVGSGNIGECTVYRWTVGSGVQPHPGTNEGPVQILNQNTTPGDEAMLKPIGACGFSAADMKYHCVTGGGANVAGTATSTGFQGATIYKFTGATIVKNDVVGQYLKVGGIGKSATTPTIDYDGAFPIIDADETTDTLTVINRTASASETKDFTTATYALLQGEGPIPQGAPGQPHEDIFLTQSLKAAPNTQTIEVKFGGAGTRWPNGVDAKNLQPIGAGFTLTGFNPAAFPTSAAADVTVTCAGTCGSEPVGAVAHGLVVTGKTTDADLTGLAPFDMPAPKTSYATFTCTALLSTSLTIPKEALAAILMGNPTRIETRVIRGTFVPVTDGPPGMLDLNKGNVLVGHTLVGHTSIGTGAK